MNVVAFVPVGILLALTFCSIRWWQALCVGCLVSLLIETMQYFFRLGFAELDDVMHNTIGGVIWYGGYLLIYSSRKV